MAVIPARPWSVWPGTWATTASKWLLFLYDETIPATNNHAESRRAGTASGGDHAQARRVQSRRAGTAWGAVYSILSSLMVSCRQMGRRFGELAKQLWYGMVPQAIALEPQPDG